MSELIITPNFEKKTARFHGVIAGGEHAPVILKDCADLLTAGLRVRVLDCRRMVALFPHLETDEFTVSGNDLGFTLNLNSLELLDSISGCDEKEFLFIIDNPSDSVRRLYADGFHSIKKWVMIEGSDTPVSLDDYPTMIEEFESRLNEVEGKANGSDLKAEEALSNTESFQGDIESLGIRVSTNEQDISTTQNDLGLTEAKVERHIEDENNPHNVTAEQLGLGDVVSDIGKLNGKLATANENIAANEQGVADAKNTADTALATANTKATKSTTLAGYGIVDAYTKTEVEAIMKTLYRYKGSKDNFAAIEAVQNPEVGDVYNDLENGGNYAWVKDEQHPNGFWDKLSDNIDLSAYDTREQTDQKVNDTLKSYVKTVNGSTPDPETGNVELSIPAPPVTSVNGKTGDVDLTADDVGAYSKGETDDLLEGKADNSAVSIRTTISKVGDGRWRISDVTLDTTKDNVLFGGE